MEYFFTLHTIKKMYAIEPLQLTEEDFDLLIRGLEAIPVLDLTAGEMTSMFFDHLSNKKMADDPKLQGIMDRVKEARNKAVKIRATEVKILTGKFISLKRYLTNPAFMVPQEFQVFARSVTGQTDIQTDKPDKTST